MATLEPAVAIEPPPTTEPEFPLPPALQHPAARAPVLVTQGAEGRLYQTTWLAADRPCAVKHRPSKPYRHPVLDARLTRHRILAEARILHKCRREGVAVPALYGLDEAQGLLSLEWVPGRPVRVEINEFLRRRQDDQGRAGPVAPDDPSAARAVDLMRRIGAAVGRLHKVGVVHGDLTTSNMMLRPWAPAQAPAAGPTEEGAPSLEGEIVIIDFGLSSQGSADEDRAVDLYVLERAFGSTHPRAETLFAVVLEAYGKAYKSAPVVLKKLEDVRLRGRKRSMLG